MEGVYEHFFYMKYYSGWSFIEFYNLPIGLRNWFLKRLSDQIEKENKQSKEASGNSNASSILPMSPPKTPR
jgi:hypothetical protein